MTAGPACPCVATGHTKSPTPTMRQSRMVRCGRGDTGPAGRTSLLHSAASHVPQIRVHDPTSTLGRMRGEGIHDEAAVSLLHGALRLFQICTSNSTPLSLPNFSPSCYFPSLKTSPSFLIGTKRSLGRVKFIYSMCFCQISIWELLFVLQKSCFLSIPAGTPQADCWSVQLHRESSFF